MLRVVLSNPETLEHVEKIYFDYNEYYCDLGLLTFLYNPNVWHYRFIEFE